MGHFGGAASAWLLKENTPARAAQSRGRRPLATGQPCKPSHCVADIRQARPGATESDPRKTAGPAPSVFNAIESIKNCKIMLADNCLVLYLVFKSFL